MQMEVEYNFLATASCSTTWNNLFISKISLQQWCLMDEIINKILHSWKFFKSIITKGINEPSSFVYVHILQLTRCQAP